VSDGVTDALLGLMATGFVAWSAVVWRAASYAREAFIRTDLTLKEIIRRIEALETRIEKHEDEPWHASAGTEIATIHRDIQRIEHTIELHHPLNNKRYHEEE
jgi:Co/Zn/Cd efflux system component